MKAKRVSKAQTLCSDRISSLPQNIIETILCLVPIREAVRTSILSREWKYYWTRIPKLMFSPYVMFGRSRSTDPSVSEQTYDIASARKKMDERCKLFYAIYQVLLLHQGPILEFTLDIYAEKGCVEIDQVIIHLSRKNTVKKFTLDCSHSDDNQYSVPLSIFSLNQLTHLRITYCDFYHQPTFNGFGSLTSLYLRCVCMSTKTLRHLLSNCPLLKCFTLLITMDHVSNRDEFTIIELFECLPIVEDLTMWGSVVECFVLERSIPQQLPTSLIHLKYFRFKEMHLMDRDTLPFLALLLRCAPNLEKIKLEIHDSETYGHENPFTPEDYSDIWLEHMNELKFTYYSGLNSEVEFVKLILAKSPVLKKVYVVHPMVDTKDEELEMLRILLRAPRASPAAEIIVRHHFNIYAV